jgi:hypothetical protein
MGSTLTDSHRSLRPASFELGDLGFEAGESRFDGGGPIVFRKGVGG